MSNLIDRQAAIDAVHEEFDGCLVWDESGEHTADEVERILDCVPSAEPERKTGRWIYNSPVTMKCEQCGYVIKDWEWNKANYCAGCGADMRGERDEND